MITMQAIEIFFHLLSFLLGIASALFAFYMYHKMQGTKITSLVLFSGIAAFLLALHQGFEGLMDIFSTSIWHAASSWLETGTLLSLLAAAYFLLKLSNDVFVPKSPLSYKLAKLKTVKGAKE